MLSLLNIEKHQSEMVVSDNVPEWHIVDNYIVINMCSYLLGSMCGIELLALL